MSLYSLQAFRGESYLFEPEINLRESEDSQERKRPPIAAITILRPSVPARERHRETPKSPQDTESPATPKPDVAGIRESGAQGVRVELVMFRSHLILHSSPSLAA